VSPLPALCGDPLLTLAEGATVWGVLAVQVRNELLDLRTWQWRPAASLQQQRQEKGAVGAGAPEEECLLNMGTVLYDGQVLAVGGRHYWKDGEWATSKVRPGAAGWSECWLVSCHQADEVLLMAPQVSAERRERTSRDCKCLAACCWLCSFVMSTQ